MSHSDQGIVSPINKIEWLWDLCGGSKPPPYEVNLTERNKSPPYGWVLVHRDSCMSWIINCLNQCMPM